MSYPRHAAPSEPNGDAIFTHQFEKDLRFFQLLLLLINKSCPIKNVDLTWTELGLQELASGPRQATTGTTQALEDAASRLLRCERTNPNPRYCQLIAEQGGEIACAISDREAAQRARRSGRSEVYRCRAGLVDIVVPVICEGRHIASLYSGQVHTSQPCREGFADVKRRLAVNPAVNLVQIEAAYHAVPVVSEEDIQQTVGILEMFAAYLATAWQRLRDAVEAQQRRVRDVQLQRKELAHILLEGDDSEAGRLREVSRALGLRRYPNRVLVVSPPGDEQAGHCSIDLTVARLQCQVEEICARWANAVVAALRWRGVCVFFADTSEDDRKAYALAQRILQGLAERSDTPVRIGIGRAKSDWQGVAESCQEARAALAESGARLVLYQRVPGAAPALRARVEAVCQALAEKNITAARAFIGSIPSLVEPRRNTSEAELVQQRRFLSAAFEKIVEAVDQLGAEPGALEALRAESFDRIELARTPLELQEAWTRHAQQVLDLLSRLYAGKHEKLVERAKSIVERRLERNDRTTSLNLADVAAQIGVSAGHLSRTFRRITGSTLERYLMQRRVERAQRLLLDPASRVSEVAERCDFCNPAYFARVFRQLAGCSPTEYSKNPAHALLRANPVAPASRTQA
jgi:AraC-like DNA-binding protein/ligand-binding sensor protein